MKRILFLALLCTSAFAASRAETTTYVDGNITGISPNTGGTLVFSDDKTMVFRTGLATVTVPYAAITRSELGATREISHGAPIYKIWARRKKTETQFLTVEFKGEEGDAKTMTLELPQSSASSVAASIQDHRGNTETSEVASSNPEGSKPEAAPLPVAAPVEKRVMKPAPKVAGAGPLNNPNDPASKASPATKPGSDWWGDDIWKTTRNAPKWKQTPAGVPAGQ